MPDFTIEYYETCEACGWSEFASDESQTDIQKDQHECPVCGEKTIPVGWAV